MRLLPTLLALAVTAGAIAMVPEAAIATTTPVPATTEPIRAGFSVDIVPRQDGIFVPGSDLTVAVRLSNDSGSQIDAGTATVALARTPVASRDELDAWLLGGADPAGADPAGADPAGDTHPSGDDILQFSTPAVAAGGSVVLPDATVPAATLPFTAGTSGVYLLSVTVTSGDLAPLMSRSAVTVRAEGSPPPTRLALAMPIALPPSQRGTVSAEDLTTYTSVGGLLDRQLTEASAQSIAIGIDPRIIASIRLLGDSAPAPALSWLERLRTVSNDTFALSYADTDIAATSQAAGVILAPTSFAIDQSLFPAEAPTQGGQVTPSSIIPADPVVPTLDGLLAWDYTLAGVAWPRDGTVVAADLSTFATSGLPTTVVSSVNVAPAIDGTLLPASGSADGRRVVISDDTLSQLLRSAVAAPTLAEWQADVARLNAALAEVGGQPGAQDRISLATLGRDIPTGQFRLAETIAAVTGSGLAGATSFSDAVTQTPAAVTVIDSPVAADRTTAIAGMFAAEASIAQFATVLDDPTQLTGERRLALMALTSQSWAADSEGWASRVADYLERTTQTLTSVVVASTNLVQTSDRNPLPIVVTNALNYPVTVTVEVVALRPIVAIQDPSVELTVPAKSQKRATIAAESIANGEVRLSVSLYSRTRVLISPPSLLDVTVNAGWETTATNILAVIVFAVFILGIIRTIRRRRRLGREERGPNVPDLSDSGAERGGG